MCVSQKTPFAEEKYSHKTCTVSFRREVARTIEAVVILVTLTVGFYPAVSNAWNQFVASKLIVRYESGIGRNQKSGEHQEGQILTDADGVMGYLEIPAISVMLPIYEGTSEEVLAKGVGHEPESSLPVGGDGTHTVLTGHRGLPSAKLFTDLDKLSKGDQFTIHTSGKDLLYEVTDIRTVLPYETESLSVKEGEDLATLVTCTPYGVNTHRLLVTGTRVMEERNKSYSDWNFHSLLKADTGSGSSERASSMGKSFIVFAAAAAAVLAVVLRILWIWLLDWPRQCRKEFRMRRRRECIKGQGI